MDSKENMFMPLPKIEFSTFGDEQMNDTLLAAGKVKMFELVSKDLTEHDITSVIVPNLEKRIDIAERQGKSNFDDFNDRDIMMYYLYRQTHIDQKKGKSPKTIDTYRKVLEQFINNLYQHLPEMAFEDFQAVPQPHLNTTSMFKGLGKRHLKSYQEWFVNRSPYVIKNGPYSPASISQKITILKTFFQTLYTWGYIDKPIHDGFLSVSLSKDERPNRDAGTADVVFLLNMFEELGHITMFTFIHVLTTTGLRNEEFCSLKVGDVRRNNINDSYYLNVIGKGNKRREVPLKDKIMRSIHLFRRARLLPPLDQADKSTPLFANSLGKAYTPSYLSKYFSKEIANLPEAQLRAVKERFRSGDEVIKISPHLFRHAYAIISHENGASPYDIMRSLGHERLETTQIYLEKVMKQEKNAIHQWKGEAFKKYI